MISMCALAEAAKKLGFAPPNCDCSDDYCCQKAVQHMEPADQEKVLFDTYRLAKDDGLRFKILVAISAAGLRERFTIVFFGGASGSEEVGL